MKRREFIAATAALLVSPRRSWAQGTPRRVDTLGNVQNLPIKKVFDESLRGHGWIEGKNLIIDYRYFEGHAERIPPLAAELVALKPDLLIATNTQTAVALKSATASIPIVFVAVADPVRLGLVQSLSHPGGNMTGLSLFVPGNFTGKAIQALRELVPTASKIANLVNPGNQFHMLTVTEELPQIAREAWLFRYLRRPRPRKSTSPLPRPQPNADAINVFGDTLTVNNVPCWRRSIVCPRAISTDNSSSMAD